MTMRKPLNSDDTAKKFVYGTEADTDDPPVSPAQEKPTKDKKRQDLFEAPPKKEATVRLTVDLPESMHRKLSLLAAKTSKKKVEIVRLLLDEALADFEE